MKQLKEHRAPQMLLSLRGGVISGPIQVPVRTNSGEGPAALLTQNDTNELALVASPDGNNRHCAGLFLHGKIQGSSESGSFTLRAGIGEPGSKQLRGEITGGLYWDGSLTLPDDIKSTNPGYFALYNKPVWRRR